jgi:hypothetical protein
MAKLIPMTAIKLVSLLLKVSNLKLLAKIPILVKMTAMVMMMERSLMCSDAAPW